MARRWHDSSAGRLWWEPWELSSGQLLDVLGLVDANALGLSLHNAAAECMVAFGGDRMMRNAASRARERGIPVVVHVYLGAASEEVEPYRSLQSPLATYDQVRTALRTPGIAGVKEYYGLDLSKPDPNLDAALLALDDPGLGDDTVLRRLSGGYGDDDVRRLVEETWRAASAAMQLYPWDASWFARDVGRSDPAHAMTAAVIRGEVAETPAWRSTRGATFLRTTDGQEPHPWLLEDLQLRWQACADAQARALATGEACRDRIEPPYRDAFAAFLAELGEFRRRVLSYVYHCRETNLAGLIRQAGLRGEPAPSHVVAELREVMRRDTENGGPVELAEALASLETSPLDFAARWFLPPPLHDAIRRSGDSLVVQRGWGASRGMFSATSA